MLCCCRVSYFWLVFLYVISKYIRGRITFSFFDEWREEQSLWSRSRLIMHMAWHDSLIIILNSSLELVTYGNSSFSFVILIKSNCRPLPLHHRHMVGASMQVDFIFSFTPVFYLYFLSDSYIYYLKSSCRKQQNF